MFNIKSEYKVQNKFMRKARFSKTCEKCGCEIPKGDHYWNWKPLHNKSHWFAWRNRCIDCEPMYYDEVNVYEDHNAKIKQISRIRIDTNILTRNEPGTFGSTP